MGLFQQNTVAVRYYRRLFRETVTVTAHYDNLCDIDIADSKIARNMLHGSIICSDDRFVPSINSLPPLDAGLLWRELPGT